MQLTRNRPIRHAVATLTAALVGSGAAHAADRGHTETSLLLYSESSRVSAAEVLFNLDRNLGDKYLLGLKLTYDGLTGATPTGAAPSKFSHTITSASGGHSTIIPAGEIPLDHHFKDTRFAVDASLGRQLGRFTTVTFGGHGSAEKDYTSFGANAAITQDLNNKNTTVGLAGSYSHDVVSPIGGMPLPYAVVDTAPVNQEDLPKQSKPKEVYDYVLSLTQILDRRTVFRVNYSYDRSTGYLNDPYKVLSIVEAPGSADPGEPINSIHESRPDAHTKKAVLTELKRFMFGCSVDISYRYFWDDWGIKAHTVDFAPQYRWSNGSTLQPHLRWYRQSAADFYLPFLVQGNSLPAFASSDSRLTKFTGYTLGLKYGFSVAEGLQMAVAAEYYAQRGDHSPPGTFGTQLNYNLFPNLDVVELRATLSHDL